MTGIACRSWLNDQMMHSFNVFPTSTRQDSCTGWYICKNQHYVESFNALIAPWHKWQAAGFRLCFSSGAGQHFSVPMWRAVAVEKLVRKWMQRKSDHPGPPLRSIINQWNLWFIYVYNMYIYMCVCANVCTVCIYICIYICIYKYYTCCLGINIVCVVLKYMECG